MNDLVAALLVGSNSAQRRVLPTVVTAFRANSASPKGRTASRQRSAEMKWVDIPDAKGATEPVRLQRWFRLFFN